MITLIVLAGCNTLLPVLNDLSYGVFQFLCSYRLYKEALHRKGVGINYRLFGGCGGEEQVGDAFGLEQLIGKYLIAQLEAVDLRHIDVRENKKGLNICRVQVFEGLGAVGKIDGLILLAQLLKYLFQ